MVLQKLDNFHLPATAACGALLALLCGTRAKAQDPYYVITNVNSGKVLDVTNSATFNGALIQQWEPTGGSNQLWRLGEIGNGYILLQNKNSGKVLDVKDLATWDGAQVQQWDWLAASNQQWTFNSDGESNSGYITNANSGKVLDVAGDPLANGSPILQYQNLSIMKQFWTIAQSQDSILTSAESHSYYGQSMNQVTFASTQFVDYETFYYYRPYLQADLYKNGNLVSQDIYGDISEYESSPYGFTYNDVGANPGDDFDVRTTQSVLPYYHGSDIDYMVLIQISSRVRTMCWHMVLPHHRLPGV